MSYKQKMLHHVAEAERFQAKAEELEDWADASGATPELAALLLSDPNKSRQAFKYKQAVGTRNGHQQRAIMYGIAALVAPEVD